MKRIICALIVAVMLVMMIPVSAISAFAEDAEPSGHLNVTHYKDNDAKVAGQTASLDWSKLWDSKNTSVRFGIGLDIKPEIIGKFDKPTEVTDVVFTFYKYHAALNHITVSFSNTPDDADSWVLLKTVVGVGGITNENMQQIEAIDCQGVKYEYVKISTTDDSYQAQYNNYNFDLYSVSFYNITDDMETLDNISHKWQPDNVDADASVLWDYTNDTLIEWNVGSSNYNTVTGEFETPTKVDFVVIKTPADKVANFNWSFVELSTDGTNWDIFQVDYAERAGDNLVFAITRDTAYSHIRFKLNPNTNFSLKAIGVVGTTTPAESETDGELSGRLNVTHYRDNGAKVSGKDEALDWSKLWDSKNQSVRFGIGLDKKPEIIGKFDKPTIVTDVVYTWYRYFTALNYITISFSNTPDDDDSWVLLKTVEAFSLNGPNMQQTDAIDCQGVKYEYVKISMTDEAYQAQYDNYNFDLYSISFYNITDDMETLENISHKWQPDYVDVDASVLWDYSNDTLIEWNTGSSFYNTVTGEFQTPTKVDFVVIKTSADKVGAFDWCSVELSVDGTTWFVIQEIHASRAGDNLVIAITNNTEYNHIRLKTNKNINFSLKAIGVVGTPQDPDVKMGKLEITHHSSSVNYHETDTTNAKDWSGIWNTSNSSRTVVKSKDPIWVIGEFAQPAYITNVVIKMGKYGSFMNNTKVSFSADLETWVDAVTVSGMSDSVEGYQPNYIIDNTVKYKYIKVWTDSYDNNYGGVSCVDVDFYWIACYNNPMLGEDKFETVRPVSQQEGINVDASILWNPNNTTALQWGGNTAGSVKITGEFAIPTEITRVILKNQPGSAARNNHTSVEASVTGESDSWVQIGRLMGQDATLDSSVLEISDKTAYKFIRIVQNNNYTFGLTAVGVVGTARPDLAERLNLIGFQRSAVVDGKYSLRLIAIGDSAELSNVGMELRAGAQNGQEWKFKATAYKFESITAGTGDSAVTITAAEKGGAAFYTVVLTDIPEDVGLFSVKVTPYFYDGDYLRNQGTRMVVIDNTKAVASKLYALEDVKENIKISGRSLELEKGIACDFTASGIEFNARLAGDIKLKVNCSGTTYYTLYLNGVRQERLRFNGGTAEYVIAKNLPAKEYNVKLVKQTHIGHTNSALLELTMTGEFLEKPEDNDILIEFVGDSITCGYGVVGYPTSGVTYYGTADYCDATEAFAYKTATSLGADYSMVAVSGWTMLKDGIPNKVYNYTSFNRDQTLYKPERTADIVVVNLGTNDMGRENYETAFVDEYEDFVLQIREMNPDAKVILVYGMMHQGEQLANIEGKLNQVVDRLGGADSEVWAVKLPHNNGAGQGHPSAAGHTTAAEVLTKFIRDNCLG